MVLINLAKEGVTKLAVTMTTNLITTLSLGSLLATLAT
jgi:hypothetical protein